jgi:peptide deformylase
MAAAAAAAAPKRLILSNGAGVCQVGDPLLRAVCREIGADEFGSPAIREGLAALHEALNAFRSEYGFGRAIAAPQLGFPFRAVALNLGGKSFSMLNPRISTRSLETMLVLDDCLSFPDKLVVVPRSKAVKVAYQDERATLREFDASDPLLSELLQHELDHLDGVLALDLAPSPECVVSRSGSMDIRGAFRAARAVVPHAVMAIGEDRA